MGLLEVWLQQQASEENPMNLTEESAQITQDNERKITDFLPGKDVESHRLTSISSRYH